MLGWIRHSIIKRRYHRLALSHIEKRLIAIQSALDYAPLGYTLLLGDSHAELIGRDGLGDHVLVNAGIGGMSSRGCAMVLPRIHMTVRASTAILSTGSNDIMMRVKPRSKRTSDEFEAAIARIFDWLHWHADNVLVLAVPPIEQLTQAPRDPDAVDDYSFRLQRIAQIYKFCFIDPYKTLRAESVGFAVPGALSDGVHLRDYGAICDELIPLIRQGPRL